MKNEQRSLELLIYEASQINPSSAFPESALKAPLQAVLLDCQCTEFWPSFLHYGLQSLHSSLNFTITKILLILKPIRISTFTRQKRP